MKKRISFSSRITSIVSIINVAAIVVGMYELRVISIPKAQIYVPLILFSLYLLAFSTLKEVLLVKENIVIKSVFKKERIFKKSDIQNISEQKLLLYGVFIIPHYVLLLKDETKIKFSGIVNGFNWKVFNGRNDTLKDLL